jgi:hypothetical protein
LLTDDTIFEDSSPAPHGRRIVGNAPVVAFWRTWFAQNADEHFDGEDIIVTASSVTVSRGHARRRCLPSA